MKKSSKNKANSSVKATKNCEKRRSNSLIKVAAIARHLHRPGQLQTPPRIATIDFQRFEQVQGRMGRARARSNLGDSARSGTKMARGAPETSADGRGKLTDAADNARGAPRSPFDHRIATLHKYKVYLEYIKQKCLRTCGARWRAEARSVAKLLRASASPRANCKFNLSHSFRQIIIISCARPFKRKRFAQIYKLKKLPQNA